MMSNFGESLPKSITSKHSGIDPKMRELLFSEYVNRKSREKDTKISKAVIAGAASAGVLAHFADEAKEQVKKKISEILKTKDSGSIFSKAQKMAVSLISKIIPSASEIPIIKGYSKNKLIAAMAGIGAAYSLNKALTSQHEKERARDIAGDKDKLKRELVAKLSKAL
jgi:hypothetical protein